MTDLVRKLMAADVPALRELRLESLRLHPECFGADLETEDAASQLNERRCAPATASLACDHALTVASADDERGLFVCRHHGNAGRVGEDACGD